MGFEREKPEPFDLTLLSSRQLRQLKWAFNVLDEDGSGSIQGHELEGVIQLIGDNPSKKEAKELLAWLDTDGDGEVSFEEFAHAWWQRPVALVEAEEGHDELALAFMIFDADHNGCVSSEELREVFTKMGERLSEEEMDEFLAWLGLRGGGSINLAAFKKLPCWRLEDTPKEVEVDRSRSLFSAFAEKRDEPAGTATVRVLHATGLVAADKDGTSDPYLVVQSAGGKKAKTSVKQGTVSPEWDETLELSVYDVAASLCFEVWDNDKFGRNDSLGAAEVLLAQCTPGTPTALTLALSTQGAIEVVVTFAPADKPETGIPAYVEPAPDPHRVGSMVVETLNRSGMESLDISAWPTSDC